MSLLTLRELHASYGGLEVLHGVDLDVAEGGALAVLGPNGSGKTTLLRAISATVARTGALTFGGRSLNSLSTDRIARLGVAHVPQGRGTLGRLSVRENLLAGALVRRDRGNVRGDFERCMAVFPELRERLRAPAASLSGGQQQMLAIGRALMGRPRLMLLDEPSLGLAPLVTRRLFETLRSLRRERGLTLLVVEQNAALTLELVDEAALLEDGLVTVRGAASDLAGDDAVRRAYLGD